MATVMSIVDPGCVKIIYFIAFYSFIHMKPLLLKHGFIIIIHFIIARFHMYNKLFTDVSFSYKLKVSSNIKGKKQKVGFCNICGNNKKINVKWMKSLVIYQQQLLNVTYTYIRAIKTDRYYTDIFPVWKFK